MLCYDGMFCVLCLAWFDMVCVVLLCCVVCCAVLCCVVLLCLVCLCLRHLMFVVLRSRVYCAWCGVV